MHPAIKTSRKPKPCRQCRETFTPSRPLQKVCSPSCALAQSRDKAKAIEAKQAAKRQRERKAELKPRSKWLQEAQAAFNGYIRERDGGPCISCQRSHTGQYHAGHYRSAGAMPSLRFNTHNVHKQCSSCNNHLSGNMIEYRINLIAKIGQDRVEWLESSHPLRSFDVDYLRRVKRVFAKRARHIRRLRNDG